MFIFICTNQIYLGESKASFSGNSLFCLCFVIGWDCLGGPSASLRVAGQQSEKTCKLHAFTIMIIRMYSGCNIHDPMII